MEHEEWTKRVGLLAGFSELDDDMRAYINRLGDMGYTDRGAAERVRQYFCTDGRSVQAGDAK